MNIDSNAGGREERLLFGFDIFLSSIIILFFLGYLNIHAELIGLNRRPIEISEQIVEFWDVFGWIVFGGIAIDVLIKYRKVGEPRIFLRRYWLDILMLFLWPVFTGLKLAKISIKVVKGLKLVKSGYKAVNASKKFSRKRKRNDA